MAAEHGMFEYPRACHLSIFRRAQQTHPAVLHAVHGLAPNLPASQHTQIWDMMDDGRFTNRQIADAAHCSKGVVKAIKRNLRDFGSTAAPPSRGGRPPSMTPMMRDALLGHFRRRPDLYLEELVVYLWDEFGVRVTKSSISRTLHSAKKKPRHKAIEQNADLIDFYLHRIQ